MLQNIDISQNDKPMVISTVFSLSIRTEKINFFGGDLQTYKNYFLIGRKLGELLMQMICQKVLIPSALYDNYVY